MNMPGFVTTRKHNSLPLDGNLKGIAKQSPGLRGTSNPGIVELVVINLTGVMTIQHAHG
jgi:hypothetical protein